MEKQYFSYVRVSTAKQGERGVSLQEQQDAILNYARRQGLQIIHSFEEKETAAKRGRPVFNQMLKQLRRGTAAGVVIHKIDRSARNLKDWADLGELIDTGVEVHFANESLDLHTRGGRLSADIQAVVAADYVRNLRDETRKGFYGRLKQGILPIAAPIGYLDQGGGKAKIPNPATAPLIRELFSLYATGEWSFPRLLTEMHQRGLRNKRGGKISLKGMSTILHNSFYTGVIRLRRSGESFIGIHEPIIDKLTFDVVQRVLAGKTIVRTHRHEFPFSRMIRCADCNATAMAEIQKGHTYYRCHTRDCGTKTIREEKVEEALQNAFLPLHLTDEETRYVKAWFEWKYRHRREHAQDAIDSCSLQLAQLQERLTRLTDAYLDGAIDRKIMDERRAALIAEQAGIQQRLSSLAAGDNAELERLAKYLELVKGTENLRKLATLREKRLLAKQFTSNLLIHSKNITITLTPMAQLIANRAQLPSGGPNRSVPRTFDRLLSQLEKMFETHKEGKTRFVA